MQLLQELCENPAAQACLDAKESEIMEATGAFLQFPQQIKDHIVENLEQFIVPGNLQATYEGMVVFAENAVVGALTGLSEQI